MGCSASVTPNSDDEEDPVELDMDKVAQVVKDKVVLEQLRNLAPKERFVDPDFGGPSAIFVDPSTRVEECKKIKWVRPKSLSPNPQLFVDGISRLDIVQGDLGDCWFLSSCAAITLRKDIWAKVIPADNKLVNAKGLYRFRFWRFGEWVEVYVDDLLPIQNGELMFAKGVDPNEIWPSLIEKAYAKLNGCYEALQSGKASEGLLDLTGGLTETFYTAEENGPELFNVIRQTVRNGGFVSCNTGKDHDGSKGLITAHAYSVTLAHKVPTSEGTRDLLRIFNPWGNTEWTGDWSDGSDKWSLVEPLVKKALGITKRSDGEFWMNFEDFCKQFERVFICTLGPDFDKDGVVDQSKRSSYHGEWFPGKNAGGCSDNLELYATNTQYRFTIGVGKPAASKDSKAEWEAVDDNKSQCALIVSLMQKYDRRAKRHNPHMKEEYINYRIYKVVANGRRRLGVSFFKESNYIEPVLGEVNYTNTREITCHFLLDPGEYVLVPATFDANVAASYLLRLYAWTSEFHCWEAP